MAFNIKQQKDWNVNVEVTASSNLTDNYVVRGDGGAKGVQTSLVSIDDNGKVSLVQSQGITFDTDKDSYFYASADDVLDLYVNSVKMITFTEGLTYLKNDSWLSFLDYAGTGYLNALKGNIDDEVDVGVQLNIGSIEFEEDAGFVTAMDMPVSSASADGTKEAYTFKIDGNNIFEVGAYADGSGGVDGEYVKIYGATIGSITTVATATYSTIGSDRLIHSTYSATGAVTITLSSADCVAGRKITIKDAGGLAGTNNITINTEGSEIIDGAASTSIITNYDWIHLYSDGSNWFIEG